MPRLICEGRYTHAPSRCSRSNTEAEQLESNQKRVVCGSVKGHMTAGGSDVHIHVYRDRLRRLVMHLLSFHFRESKKSSNAADAESEHTRQARLDLGL